MLTVFKGKVLAYFNYLTFWERQSYADSNRSVISRGFRSRGMK